MKKCQNCQAEQPSDLTTTCIYCGFEIRESSEEQHDQSADNYSETSNEYDNNQTDNEISLEIDSPESYLGSAADDSVDDDFSPIGTSAPIMPEPLEVEPEIAQDNPTEEETTTSGIKRLSDEEVKSIEKELYGSSNYLSGNENDNKKHRFPGEEEDQAFGNAPIIPPVKHDSEAEIKPVEIPETDLPKPKFSNSKGRGVAFFYKNYIQLLSQQHLNDEDVIVVNDREYSLKPKDLKMFKITSISAAAAILLLVLSISMFGGSSTGYGQITGFVLDENDHPFTQGVTVELPEAGKSTKTNPQGFFQLTSVPTGAHQIDYLIDGEVVKTDYVTVVNDEESLVLLKPEVYEEYAEVDNPPDEPTVEKPVVESKPSEPTKPAEPQKPTHSKTKSVKKQSTTSQYSKVSLNANVQGAKFVLDGKVVGAGNMTYSKIQPGNHEYTVSADGYDKKTGSFYVKAGDNKTLSVVLSPLSRQAKMEQFDENDYKYSARTAFSEGDYKTTISDLSAYLKDNPGDPEAYYLRAEAYEFLAQADMALNDYVRAAEIYTFQKEYYNSINSYTKALEIDDKSITAYLGRGKVYLAKNEPLAAIADFDYVTKIDRRNFDAYYGLGEATFAQQRYKTAIDYFKDARSIDDGNPLVHQYLMLSYLAVDDHKNLKKSFDKFKDVASDRELKNLYGNPKYSAALKVIEMD